MAGQFYRAQRKKAGLRLAIAGPAGGGKTYSALQIALGPGGRLPCPVGRGGSNWHLIKHLQRGGWQCRSIS